MQLYWYWPYLSLKWNWHVRVPVCKKRYILNKTLQFSKPCLQLCLIIPRELQTIAGNFSYKSSKFIQRPRLYIQLSNPCFSSSFASVLGPSIAAENKEWTFLLLQIWLLDCVWLDVMNFVNNEMEMEMEMEMELECNKVGIIILIL